MGIVYCGPFADAINEGTRYGHEGYAVQILPDGAEFTRWVTEFRAYRAGCDCGWRGAATYPPTEAGETAAQEEWNDAHLRVLLRTVATGKVVAATAVLDLIDGLRRELSAAVAARPDGELTIRELGRCDVIEALESWVEDAAVDAPVPPSGSAAGRVGGAW